FLLRHGEDFRWSQRLVADTPWPDTFDLGAATSPLFTPRLSQALPKSSPLANADAASNHLPNGQQHLARTATRQHLATPTSRPRPHPLGQEQLRCQQRALDLAMHQANGTAE